MSDVPLWGIFIGAALFMWWLTARSNARERARGEEKRARVLSSVTAGRRNLNPLLLMSLEVHAPDGHYEVQLEEAVDYTDLHRFAEGRMVDVYVDPNHREHLALCDPEIAKIHRKSQAMLEESDKLLRGD